MSPLLTRILVYAALAGLVLSLAELDGYRRGEKKLYEYQAQQATAAVSIVVKRGAVAEKIVTKYVQVREERKAVADEIKKEVIRYENPGYCLDALWGELHDDSAANTVSDPASRADDTSRAPTAAGALETVTENYAACHRTADKLDALQEWVKGQAAVK